MYSNTENNGITNKINNYVYGNDVLSKNANEKKEVKPSDFDEHETATGEEALEHFEKKNKLKLSNENRIICDNILDKFFDLDDKKFMLCIEKINEWGFELCFKHFIIDYYLNVIKDNRLRQYIISNLSSILITLKDRLDRKLIENMSKFNFKSSLIDQRIDIIKNDIKVKEQELLPIEVDGFSDFAPVDEKIKKSLTEGEKDDIRKAVMNRLRYENPNFLRW